MAKHLPEYLTFAVATVFALTTVLGFALVPSVIGAAVGAVALACLDRDLDAA